MDLHTGVPYWSAKNSEPDDYGRLEDSQETEVLVIGAGISGALIAWKLVQEGRQVMVIDKRRSSAGSTLASTAIIQYEIDSSLTELATRYEMEKAVLSYKECERAVQSLIALDNALGNPGRSQPRRTLYLCSTEQDLPNLKAEFEARIKHGFECEWMTRKDIQAISDLDYPAAIVTFLSAELDPYSFTQFLWRDCVDRGLRLHDQTSVCEWRSNDRAVEVVTNTGVKVTARWAVVAAGYESVEFYPVESTKLVSTYALASQPIDSWEGWPSDMVVWETARPYIYARRTDDHRLIAGGEDVPFQDEEKRDALLPQKTKALEKKLKKMFPRISIEPRFAWTGTFGETEDGLPFIGPVPGNPRLYMAQCFGGNGITFAMLAAEMCRDHLEGKSHPLDNLFGFTKERCSTDQH